MHRSKIVNQFLNVLEIVKCHFKKWRLALGEWRIWEKTGWEARWTVQRREGEPEVGFTGKFTPNAAIHHFKSFG